MNPWVSQVNQRLFFAGLLLKQHDPEKDTHSHIELVLCQSAVYQLESAYGHHLREVAAAYKCANTEDIKTVHQLIAALESSDKHPSEAIEMLNLEGQKDSWLSQLLTAWNSFQELPQITPKTPVVNAIEILDITSTSKDSLAVLNIATVKSWLLSATELVERHRELMVEF